jgi:pSer/pThr/pTyr-binding forkhead associated (FHA) protein
MDSSNGIFVNDKKVKRHILQDQDQLRIGECRFVYHRTGEFEETTAQNKSVTTEILRPTVQYDGEVMTELIVKALQESQGDVAKVAEATDLPIEKIQEIGKKYGVL